VTIAQEFQDLHQALVATPAAVKDAFIRANPGLQRGAIAVGCQGRRLTEVRLCLSKDLKFRACPDVVAHSCRRDELLITPLRGNAGDAAGSVR
jgi:ribonuclease T2